MNKSIGFIGGGNMAEALIGGLRKTDGEFSFRVNDVVPERLNYLRDKYGVIPSGLREAAETPAVVVVAVKPKDVRDVLENLRQFEVKGKLIVSIAAGIPLKLYERYLPDAAVVRVMPNTSTAVLHSMTGLAKGQGVTAEQAAAAEKIFAAIGRVLWIPEEKMNALTALSGSGPAYFYYFTEKLVQAGIQLGLSEKEAELLAGETLAGAGKMLLESGKSPEKLREEVTSPNGTTFAALTVFREEGLGDVVMKAAEACARRAEEMEGEYSA